MGVTVLFCLFYLFVFSVVSQKVIHLPSLNELDGFKEKGSNTSEKYSLIKTSTASYPTTQIDTNSPINRFKNDDFGLICPGRETRIPIFSLPCRVTKDCAVLGNNKLLCCSDRCVKGVPPPKPEIKHSPTWFGLVDRRCPKEPLAEIFQVKECKTDADCAPRICCPEKINGNDYKSYCRIAEPILDKVPLAKQLFEPFRMMASYMQCTPPPPPFLDLFPKECKNALDCFPNLCCQERGKKFCRPPKRSILALAAGLGQRIVPSQIAKRFIERLN